MKMQKNDAREKLLKMLQTATGNDLDVYHAIYADYLRDSDDPAELFQLFLEYREKIGVDDGASKQISFQIKEDTENKYQEHLLETVKLLIEHNDTKEVFYKNLWEAVFNSPTYPKDSEACAVILKMLNERVPLLPYYQVVGLIEMDDDEYAARIKKLKPQILEAIHMLNRHFNQKTEESSQILRLSQNLEIEDQSVFWAAMINVFQQSSFAMGYEKAKEERTDNAEGTAEVETEE